MDTNKLNIVFYKRMGILLIALIIAGFTPVVFKRFDTGGTMSPALAVHGVIYLSWYILFYFQASLISKQNIALHMKLGKLSPYLAIAMTLTAILMMKASYDAGSNGGTPFSPEHFIILPFWAILAFATFYTMAFLKRSEPIVHKHYMVFACILIMDPATARIAVTLDFLPLAPILHFGLVGLVMWFDKKTLGKIHQVTKLGFVFLLSLYASMIFVGPTEAWARFVHWMLG